jgi:hypothetical protein
VTSALAEWKGCCRSPVNSLETALIAEGAAEEMEPPADAWLDVLAGENRVEATLIRARLRWRQEKMDEAAALLVEGYAQYRTDPWAFPAVVARSFTVAELTAAERPDLAPRIHDALSAPFAIRSLDHQRKAAALSVARRLERDCGPRVIRSLHAFEPWIPWEKKFLTVRAECYEKTGDPRAVTATRDLEDLLATEPEPLLN